MAGTDGVFGHEAAFLEHLEVLGDGRAAHRELVGQLADGAGALGEAFEDGSARSVAERAPRVDVSVSGHAP